MNPLYLLFLPIIQIILGIIVFLKNPKNPQHWSFGLMMISIAGWAIPNMLFDIIPPEFATLNSRLNFFAASMIVSSLFTFSISLDPKRNNSWIFGPIILGLAFGLFSLTPAVEEYVIDVSGEYVGHYNWGHPIFAGYIFSFVVLILFTLIDSFRKSTGVERYKIGYILLGTFLSIAVGITTNLIIPLASGIRNMRAVGPAGTIFFTIFSAYAILKYRFLDVRVVIRRSLMYGILFSVVAGLIAFFVILLARAIENSFAIHAWAAAGVIAVLIALAFHPLKKIVQKLVELLVPPQPAPSPLPEDAQELITKSGVLLRKVLKVDAITVTPRHEMCAHGWSERCAQHFETLSVERRRALTLEQIPTLRTPELNAALNILEKCLVENDIVVAVPMLSRSRELLGVITLKPKPKNTAYTPEEIVYLEAFSGAISLRLEQILIEEGQLLPKKI